MSAVTNLARYEFTPELLAGMLIQDNVIDVTVIDGIPKTAKLVNAYYSPERNIFGLVFEDDSFEKREVGDVLPANYVTIKSNKEI